METRNDRLSERPLVLVMPEKEHEALWQDVVTAYRANGEKGRNGLHLGLGVDEYDLYLSKTWEYRQGINLEEGRSPKTEYFLLDKEKQMIVGSLSVRHVLTPSSITTGGHVGCSIRPGMRGKGYGTLLLQLALAECEKLGIMDALVTCNKDNYPSAAVIKKCGGILENEFVEDDGTVVERYWIHLGRVQPKPAQS